MVEKDTVAGKYLVCLSVVDGDPVTIQLGCTWGGRRGGGGGRGGEGKRRGGKGAGEERRGGKKERREGSRRGEEGRGGEWRRYLKRCCVFLFQCAQYMHSEQETRKVSCDELVCSCKQADAAGEMW